MTLPRPAGRNERVDPKPEELGLRSHGQKAAASGTRSLVMARTMAMIGHQGEQSKAWNATQVGSSLEYLRLRPFPEGKQAEDGHFLWLALFVHSGRPQALLHPL